MQTHHIIDISEEDIRKLGVDILDILLKDRTTNKNILWAVDDYTDLGDGYLYNNEIKAKLITRCSSNIIQPRISKEKEKKNIRTQKKAEVFTPAWLCNEQNNLIDSCWFGRKDVFNTQNDKTWKAVAGKIVFPDTKGRAWCDYVDSRRMEITCGEAPYLVSRYDAVTGESIPLSERIGLLDRKLRVVNENIDDEKEWLRWITRAFQSIYGFEYQGDSLLLARENLLYTYIDNMVFKLGRKPTALELRRIAVIISWNIWQMDGLTYTAPLSDVATESSRQLCLFNMDGDASGEIYYCKIKDWRAKKIVEFRSIIKSGEKARGAK